MITVLVAYASKHGSTAEIARMIGETLRMNGISTDVRSVEDVTTLAEYDALILGSAVYSGSWLQQAVAFLHQRKEALGNMPLWLFSSGPVAEGDPLHLMGGAPVPADVAEIISTLNIREQQVFHGKIDLRKLSLAELALFKSVGARSGDFRHWDMIKLWAQSIRDELVGAVAR